MHENLLARRFNVGVINRAWASDITYLWTLEGWLYLAVTIDVGSRRVIGWNLGASLETGLVAGALDMAVATRGGARGVLFHSDRGTQYGSQFMQQRHEDLGSVASMSRAGDCWDNAVVESFFATLKGELAEDARWETRSQARNAVASWIEGWYNRERLHSSLGFLSPVDYELQIAKTN